MKLLHELQKLGITQKCGLSLKVFIIGLIALILMIPGMMVKNMMLDRQHHSEAARTEINAMWSGKQKLIGPILEIPYIEANS